MFSRSTSRALPSVLVLALIAGPGARAAENAPPRYDQVRLSASAGREVDTDTLVAEVFKEHIAESPAAAADVVNRDMRWGIAQAKEAGVQVETASYRTQPVYRKQHLSGWRVHQSIRLQSRDPESMATLLGTLQERLSIQSLRNTLSVEAARATEDGLIADALLAFQERAALIARTLGRDSHRIVKLDVNASGRTPQPPGVVMRAAEMSRAQVAPPPVEAGRQRVEVQVNGTIELSARRP